MATLNIYRFPNYIAIVKFFVKSVAKSRILSGVELAPGDVIKGIRKFYAERSRHNAQVYNMLFATKLDLTLLWVPALIVAIFHERMDLMTRLVDRLKE